MLHRQVLAAFSAYFVEEFAEFASSTMNYLPVAFVLVVVTFVTWALQLLLVAFVEQPV